MDQIHFIETVQKILHIYHQAKENLSPDFLLIILGPTAAGKTKIAVELARKLQAEIISADSRQIYKHLDIGTGKDLEDYAEIPYHLINIIEPAEQYNVKEFKKDFCAAYQSIKERKKQAILCGGSGSYIHSILQSKPYANIPTDEYFHQQYRAVNKEELIALIKGLKIPEDFQIDWNSHKRLIRALEILMYLKENPMPINQPAPVQDYLIIGLLSSLEVRRDSIDKRLDQRLTNGLINEVENLLASGLSHQKLQWLGLEYKYASLYLLGEYTEMEFREKLKTEIHRFAKRQMTYFRKMEKDGLQIHWIG